VEREPQPAVLVVDDEPDSVTLLEITLGMECRVYTATSGAQALERLAAHPDIGVAIIDQRMPAMTGTELIQRTIEPYPDLVRIILTGYTDVESLIQAINAGRVYRYLTKPWERDELLATVRQGMEVWRLARENRRLHAALEEANQRLRRENAQLRREARGRHRFAEIVGNSPALRATLELLERVVAADGNVLVTGETGTGKELVARAIHYNGARADGPFVAENCAALAPELLTSELFGHRRGAFTGALEDRAGLFEEAHRGTLFLDEIGDCPPEVQVRLLRVLDQREIRRVGDNRPIAVDVRVIAATHRDLEALVDEGRFRRDLFYRLSVFTVALPPLRARREDIPLLAQHFLERHCARRNRRVLGLSAEALARLAAHDFAGNVRELDNEVERAVALCEDGAWITPDLLSPRLAALEGGEPSAGAGALRAALERFEAQFLREALARNGGNQTHTAAELGLSRRGLIDKLIKYGLRG